jgi:hypothetical protein
VDVWGLSLSGVSVCFLQQRLRQHVVNDFDDHQPLHSHHLPASLSKDLSEKIYHTATVWRVVHFISDHGEICQN